MYVYIYIYYASMYIYIYIYYVSIELFICPNYKGLVTGHFFTLDLGPGIT